MGKVKGTITIDIETSSWGVDDIIIEWDRNEDDMWWTTLKGENIRIDKMDTAHLKNTLSMLKRNGRYKLKRTAGVYRNMQEEYFKRLSPAGEVLYGKNKV